MVVQEADTSRFKEDIDAKLLDKFFVWAAEGFANGMQRADEKEQMAQIEAFMRDFFTCIDWMKKYFYKEEQNNEV